MIEVGRLCLKIAGRDAGKKAVIIDVLDKKFVLLDGEVRRRKCNVSHIEPLRGKLDIEKGASHEAVAAEFDKLGWKARETKPKAAAEKQVSKRSKKSAEKKEAKSQASKEKAEAGTEKKSGPKGKTTVKGHEQVKKKAAKKKPAASSVKKSAPSKNADS